MSVENPAATGAHCLVLSTCPAGGAAESLARGLIMERLAACVNMVPGVTSLYPWQGKIETAQETLLVIKTRASAYEAVQAYLRQHHPYELPEIIAVPLDRGLPDYLLWLDACLTPQSAT